MPSLKRLARLALAAAAMAVAATPAVRAEPPAPTVIADIDLTGHFNTPSPWRFTAAQGPSIDDPYFPGGGKDPGDIRLCLRKGASAPCDPQVQGALRPSSKDDIFSEPHYLNQARIVYGAFARPLLLVQTASLHSGDGDQLVFTQVFAYRRSLDQFVRVYDHLMGRNNNQEVRFIESGPLRGDIISVEPTDNAPFGFWVTVNALARGGAYQQVLRYRSATRYNDNNPLAVIDSEMPNIEQRLGLWRPGEPLPVPAHRCGAPHLIRMELWCG